MTHLGLGADEEAISTFADGSGTVLGSTTVTAADLVTEFPNATAMQQVSVEAGAEDEFYVEEVVFRQRFKDARRA